MELLELKVWAVTPFYDTCDCALVDGTHVKK